MQGHVHWADVLFSKITDEVKLVGPTINCEGSPQGGNPANVWRKNPHVQSYVVATDRTGMQILLDDQNVFKCYNNMWDTIYHSELGSSAAILDAGYNIDSLMVRFDTLFTTACAPTPRGTISPYSLPRSYLLMQTAFGSYDFCRVKIHLLVKGWRAQLLQ